MFPGRTRCRPGVYTGRKRKARSNIQEGENLGRENVGRFPTFAAPNLSRLRGLPAQCDKQQPHKQHINERYREQHGERIGRTKPIDQQRSQ